MPELKLPEVAEKLHEGLDKGYDFIVTNFANGDVIGHTSSDEAKPKACEAVSRYVGRAVKHAREQGYTVLVTADHGNIEILHTPEGKPHVSHTTNLVACVALGEGTKKLKEHGKLCDVAPTILSAMGIEQPEEMTGERRAPVQLRTFRQGAAAHMRRLGIGRAHGQQPHLHRQHPRMGRLAARLSLR